MSYKKKIILSSELWRHHIPSNDVKITEYIIKKRIVSYDYSFQKWLLVTVHAWLEVANCLYITILEIVAKQIDYAIELSHKWSACRNQIRTQ